MQAACQDLIDALVAGYRVPPIRVRVLAQRPADDGGELHGLYEPDDAGTPARITVWMRTAARKDVVAFKTFLRTLVHELCHHLDYELYKLPETFHTEGFYKRESSLVNALLREESTAGDLPGVESALSPRSVATAHGAAVRDRPPAPGPSRRLPGSGYSPSATALVEPCPRTG